MYPKYPKHWPYTVAHTVDCVCSKMLNHGINHGLFLSPLKLFGWKYILNWIKAILPETSPFLSDQMAVLSSFFKMFIVLGMYNFEQDENATRLLVCIHFSKWESDYPTISILWHSKYVIHWTRCNAYLLLTSCLDLTNLTKS